MALAPGLMFHACWPFGEDGGDHRLEDSTALAGLLEANNLEYLDVWEIAEVSHDRIGGLRAPGLGLEVVEPFIGKLRGLQSFDLSENRIRVLSEGFFAMGGLLRMNLRDNLIDSIAPGLSALRSLYEINLSNNRLTALPPEISSMPRLHTLYLEGNRIAALPPDFGRIEDLFVLDVSDNELTTLPASLIIGRNFSILQVRGNRLCNLPGEVGEALSLHDPDWRATQRCP